MEKQSVFAPRVRPNPSVEARPNGRPPGPGWWYAYIFTRPGLASHRRSRLTSNVRPQQQPRRALEPPACFGQVWRLHPAPPGLQSSRSVPGTSTCRTATSHDDQLERPGEQPLVAPDVLVEGVQLVETAVLPLFPARSGGQTAWSAAGPPKARPLHRSWVALRPGSAQNAKT